MSKVCGHPPHLLQDQVPGGDGSRPLSHLGQPPGGPETVPSELCHPPGDPALLLDPLGHLVRAVHGGRGRGDGGGGGWSRGRVPGAVGVLTLANLDRREDTNSGAVARSGSLQGLTRGRGWGRGKSVAAIDYWSTVLTNHSCLHLTYHSGRSHRGHKELYKLL